MLTKVFSGVFCLMICLIVVVAGCGVDNLTKSDDSDDSNLVAVITIYYDSDNCPEIKCEGKIIIIKKETTVNENPNFSFNAPIETAFRNKSILELKKTDYQDYYNLIMQADSYNHFLATIECKYNWLTCDWNVVCTRSSDYGYRDTDIFGSWEREEFQEVSFIIQTW